MGSFKRRGARASLALALVLFVVAGLPAVTSGGDSASTRGEPVSSYLKPVAGAAAGPGERLPFTLTLQGSDGPNEILIWYSISSGRFVISANGVLRQPVGPDGKPISACVNPGGKPNRLSCAVRAIGGFEVDAGRGNDSVIVTGKVRVSTTLYGGPGNDDLAGGGNTDRLIGGEGHDKLAGRKGADYLRGGPHRDQLFGGPGPDVLFGGPGPDVLRGGPGRDIERQGPNRRSAARRG